MSDTAPKLSTVEDLLAIHEDKGMELVDGEIVRKSLPSFEHGRLQSRIVGNVVVFDKKGRGGGEPGGWWIASEVEVQYDNHNCFRHDGVGWRRSRVPERPEKFPVDIRPDWVCEVLSKSNRSNDTVRKFRNLFQAEVPYYWVADPRDNELTVFKWSKEGYLVLDKAYPGEKKVLEPFGEVEIDVASLFGVEDEEQDE